MEKCKFELGQACIIKQYNIEGIVESIWYNRRNINVHIEVEYLDKDGVIQTKWVGENELDFITIPSTEDIPTTEDE